MSEGERDRSENKFAILFVHARFRKIWSVREKMERKTKREAIALILEEQADSLP